MDLFKKENMKYATSLDWNCGNICKRCKGDTRRLHKLSRTKLKNKLIKEVKENGYTSYERKE